MKLNQWTEIWRSREELVAAFGQAQLVRTPEGKYELKGGTAEDRLQAKEWISLFLHEAFPTIHA